MISYAESVMKEGTTLLRGKLAFDAALFNNYIDECWVTKKYAEHGAYGLDGKAVVDYEARQSVSVVFPDFAVPLAARLNDIAYQYARDNFDTTATPFRTNTELFSYPVGRGIKLHTDDHAQTTTGTMVGVDFQRGITTVLYLNNDYSGGEIEFPRQGLKIKPEVGEFVMFPSNKNFPHQVLPITNGRRNSMQLIWGLINPATNNFSG
jgi:predicted 2-oxoglutarate/Fe(II)-dependent dioxygenase YbiX